MGMNVELVLILIFIFVAIYIIFDKDIFAPPIIVTIVFLVCSYLAIYSHKRLQLELSRETLFVIIGGVGALATGGVIVHLLFRLTKRKRNVYLRSIPQYIPVKNVDLLFLTTTLIFAVSAVSIVKLSMKLSDGSLSSLIYAYRLNMLSGNERIPGIVSNLITVNYGIGYCLIYISVHNWFVDKRVNRKLIQMILYPCLTALLSGSRGEPVHYFVFFVTVYHYYYLVKRKKSHIDRKLLLKFFFILIAASLTFYLMKFAIGRQDELDAFEYITSHLASPIKLLDLFISERHSHSVIWGEESFTRIISSIMKWTGKGDLKYRDYASFRYINDVSLGNVYTAFRAYYSDFGIKGVIAIPLIIGIVVTWFFETFKAQDLFEKSNINKALFLYAYLVYGLAMMFYSNQILEYMVNLSFIKILIVWMFFEHVFVKGKWKIKI